MHHHRYAATLLASVVGLMSAGAAVAAAPAAKPMHHHMDRHVAAVNHHGGKVWDAKWKIDGIFGQDTDLAVREFQNMKGLKVDGVAGPATFKALGLPYSTTLRKGDKGETVKTLQKALKACWMMSMDHHGKPHPHPMPKPSPSMAPTPMPTPMETPSPAPTPMETPSPMPTESPSPMATESPAEENTSYRPTFEIRGGDWILPQTAHSTAYDWSFQRPTWNGDVKLWWGDWGIGAGVTDFTQFQALDNAALVGPVYMYNGDLMWRSATGLFHAKVGYRGLNTQGFNFGEVGLGWDIPLGIDWLLLQLHGSAGHNFSNAYFADGLAGLELRLGPVGIDAGYRALYMNMPGGTNTWMAPQGSIHLMF